MAETNYAPDPRTTPLQYIASRGYGPARLNASNIFRAPVRITTASTPRFTVDNGTDEAFKIWTGGVQIIQTTGFTWLTLTDALTTSQPVGTEIYHALTSGNVGGVNSGVSLDLRADGTTATRQMCARIIGLLPTPTAPITSQLRFHLTIAGVSTEILRLDGTGLSFLQTKVVGARQTSWVTLTGTPTTNAGALDTASVTTAQLAQVVKALVDALITHGLIGA